MHASRTRLRVLLVTGVCPLGGGVLIGRLIGAADPRPLVLEGVLPLIAITATGIIAGRSLYRRLPLARVYKFEIYNAVRELVSCGRTSLLMFEGDHAVELALGCAEQRMQIVRPEEWGVGSRYPIDHTVYVIEKDGMVSKWLVQPDPLSPGNNHWSSMDITLGEVDELLHVLEAHSQLALV